jgi:hypothetical protein
MLDEDKADDPSQIARWGSDEVRHEFRAGIEQQIAVQMAMRREAAANLKPSPVEMSREAGFAFCSGELFPEVRDVVAAARGLLAAANIEKLKENSNKPFMMRLLKKKSFGLDSPFMRLALNPDVIATASRYLGVVPILQFVNVYYSAPSEDLSKSQLYHCDSDDVEQVKLWVLCDDVTAETGPLTLLPPAESDLVRKKTGYRYDTLLQDEEVSAILGGRDKEQQFVGPAGTTGFIDTSRCLHFGSRFNDPSMSRLIFMAHYVTPMSFIIPPQYWEHARYRELGTTPGLDDVSRMILGAI